MRSRRLRRSAHHPHRRPHGQRDHAQRQPQLPAHGRLAGRRCTAQTKQNKRKRPCTRTVTAATLRFTGQAGTDKVRFEGVISKRHQLKPGSYTLLVTATASGRHSTTSTLHFTIAG